MPDRTPATVLFLCPHGGAKSVIAAAYFNRLAAERNLALVAVAAAAEEPYDAVPPPVLGLLRADGLAEAEFRPRKVGSAELESAAYVIVIDSPAQGREPDERWDDVPKASEDLPGSAAALRERVERLIERLAPGRETWGAFLAAMGRIACHSFGGPIAQIGVVHEEVVERRRWMSEAEFSRALAFANALPGPEALELVIHVGWLRRGVAGGIVAGLLFAAPGVVSLTLLAALYSRYGAREPLPAIASAIRPVAVGLVAAAAFRLSRRLLRSRADLAVAVAAFLATHFLGAPFLFVLAAAAATGLAIRRSRAGTVRRPAVFAAVFLAAAAALGVRAAPVSRSPGPGGSARSGNASLSEIAAFNARTALVTFGGAYTALAYMREQAVEHLRWVPEETMLDALALGETTPGPLISIGVFLSYLAGGPAGAAVGALCLFLPSFLLVLGLARHVDRLTSVPTVRRLLDGILAGSIGILLALTADVAGRAAAPLPAVAAAATFAAVTWLRASPPVLVLLAALVGVAAGLLR